MGYIYVIKYTFSMESQEFHGNPQKPDDVAIVFPEGQPGVAKVQKPEKMPTLVEPSLKAYKNVKVLEMCKRRQSPR